MKTMLSGKPSPSSPLFLCLFLSLPWRSSTFYSSSTITTTFFSLPVHHPFLILSAPNTQNRAARTRARTLLFLFARLSSPSFSSHLIIISPPPLAHLHVVGKWSSSQVVYICVFMRASLSLSLSSPPHFYNLSFRPPSLNIFSPPLSLFFIVYLSRTPKIYFIFLSLSPEQLDSPLLFATHPDQCFSQASLMWPLCSCFVRPNPHLCVFLSLFFSLWFPFFFFLSLSLSLSLSPISTLIPDKSQSLCCMLLSFSLGRLSEESLCAGRWRGDNHYRSP
ncbi:unnamed protein product [Acanthosepion pharaonis]|uniref:Uncharacterized protein n=1 Tax=Acanthosepion pharaonis TaxID=158019 RepID=A0A812EH66_ACAPH|nr:unnamed protein product [Sepia pharaonis]